MTLKKHRAVIKPDDSTLLHYESLRSQVLDKQKNFSERGLALFIRRGMLAWMEVCHRCMSADLNRQKRMVTPVFAYSVTSEIVKVMANITLFNLEETLS